MQNPCPLSGQCCLGPVLITCALPRKKKASLEIHPKLSICRVNAHDKSYQEVRGGHWKNGRIREARIKQPFYKMQRINPLGSTVITTSLLYCIYSLILLLWV
ncbi:unnamed protein product [Staurois parvus]|uniref:Uncharacterized protein n=1 Tax=Staurois parvus TaxID=386267 RepID=A0ABN9BVP4_9NEOB|nr:unnamed protein product [Staurois parvus]